MADIENIQNGDLGVDVKNKLNETIAEANKLRDVTGQRLIGNITTGVADAGEITVDTEINATTAASDDSIPTTKSTKTYVDTAVGEANIDLVDDDAFNNPRNDTASSSQAIKAYVDGKRPAFVKFTSGTTALTQTSNGTYVYNISDFVGTGLDTSKIFEIHMAIDINSIYGGEHVYANYPDGTEYTVEMISSNDNNRPISRNCIAIIPINVGQTQFQFRMVRGIGGSRSVTLIGAKQA